MKKSGGGGLGFVILVVSLVIVLLLAARAWNSIMPLAAQALRPGGKGPVDDHGQTEVGKAVRSGNLPDLKQMGQNTDQHIKQVQDTAKGQD